MTALLVMANASRFSSSRGDDNATCDCNVSMFDVNFIRPLQLHASSIDWATIFALRDVSWYLALALGIPGNILSAIVWLRHYVAGKNTSVIYLAVLAIVNLIYLLSRFLCLYLLLSYIHLLDGWLWYAVNYIAGSVGILEPLLILRFAGERLIAIRRPLQVSRMFCTYLCTAL